MVFKCSIPGCNNLTTPEMPMHCLPKDYELRRKWCKAIRRNDLIDFTGTERYKFRICDAHFAKDTKFQQNRKKPSLKFDAVPTLNLEGKNQNLNESVLSQNLSNIGIDNKLQSAESLSILNGTSNDIEIVIEDDDVEEENDSELFPKIVNIFSLCDAQQEKVSESLIGKVELVDIQSLKMKMDLALSQNNDASIGEEGIYECFVRGCESTSENQVMFSVPADSHRMQLWDLCISYNIGNTNFLTRQDFICQKHFHKDDLVINENSKPTDTQLCTHAIPCVPYYESCAVQKCSYNNFSRMFPFPVLNKKLLNRWINALKYKPFEDIPIMELLKHRICKWHFPLNQVSTNGNLDANAVPHYYITTSSDDLMSHKMECIYFNCLNNNKNREVMAKIPIDSNNRRLKTLITKCMRRLINGTTIEHIYSRIAILNYGLCTQHYSAYDSQNRFIQHYPSAYDENIAANTYNSIQKKVNSKRVCFYRNCHYPISTENPLYTFPQQKDKYQLWWDACGWNSQDSEKPPELSSNGRPQICSEHFDRNMIKMDGRLLANAIPIKFIAPANKKKVNEAVESHLKSISNDYDNCIKDDKKTLKVLPCAVRNCDSLSRHYKFPNPQREQDRFQLWYRFCENTALKNISRKMIVENFVICGKHFESVFYVGFLQLSSDAIPTLISTDTRGKISTFENYRTKVNSYLHQLTSKQDMQRVTNWADMRYPLAIGKRKNCCIFERDRLAFPGFGKYLKIKKIDNHIKLPYTVYKYTNSSSTPQRVSNEVKLCESMTVHSVIIIDDDDECERRILNQLNVRKNDK